MCAVVFSRNYLVNGGIFRKDALYLFLQLSVKIQPENFLGVGSIVLDTITVAL
jgi:hypothetical protein